MRFVCLYDGTALPDEVLEVAARTHPEHLRGAAAVPCLTFVPPEEFSPGTASEPPESAVDLPLTGRDFRRTVAERALDAGLAQRPADDFVTGANEILTNAVQHGRPPVRAQLWSTDDELVCRVTDSGYGDSPTRWRAGSRRSAHRAPAGDYRSPASSAMPWRSSGRSPGPPPPSTCRSRGARHRIARR